MKRVVLIATIIALLSNSLIALAITDGALDGAGHPHVGVMVAKSDEGRPMWQCSGTLLSSTVFITAGHCTASPAVRIELWFDADIESGIPANGYPFHGEVAGIPLTHPEYDLSRFYYRDVGLVLLDSPHAAATYGVLPKLDELDAVAPNRHTRFTAVGYGAQRSFPEASEWKDSDLRVRMVAEPWLVQINTKFTGDYSMLLSNNASGGGTCHGDSGGPSFIGNTNVIAGITSFGKNGHCSGAGGVYRLDRLWNLAWIALVAPGLGG